MISEIKLFEKEESYIRNFEYGGQKVRLSELNENENILVYYNSFSNILSNILFSNDFDKIEHFENENEMNNYQEKMNDLLFSISISKPLICEMDNENLSVKIQEALINHKFDWLQELSDIGLLSKDRIKEILQCKVEVDYIPDDSSSLEKFLNSAKNASIRVKKKAIRVEENSDHKIMIVKSEEIIDIIENEEKSLKKGDDITTSPEIRRASILRDNINVILPYPLKCVKIEAMDKLEAMKIDFPNFVEVIDDIMGYVVLSSMGKNSYFQMKPMLLAGDPGVGKTAFAQKVSKILELKFKKLPFPTISASWVVTGLDLSFRGGKQGKLFDFLSQAEMANPIVFLDELDKSKQSSEGGNPLDILHDLLEGETSVDVIDEGMNLGINASKIVWIATANILDKIPGSILSRFKIYEIEDIEETSKKVHVIKNVYKGMVANMPNSEIFEKELDEEIAILVKNNNIRVISNILSTGIARAAKRMWLEKNKNLIKLKVEDVNYNSDKDPKAS